MLIVGINLKKKTCISNLSLVACMSVYSLKYEYFREADAVLFTELWDCEGSFYTIEENMQKI